MPIPVPLLFLDPTAKDHGHLKLRPINVVMAVITRAAPSSPTAKPGQRRMTQFLRPPPTPDKELLFFSPFSDAIQDGYIES